MEFVIYKLNRMDLIPDKYGNNLVIKMLTQYNEKGEFVKHIKLNENAIEILKAGFFVPVETKNCLNEVFLTKESLWNYSVKDRKKKMKKIQGEVYGFEKS